MATLQTSLLPFKQSFKTETVEAGLTLREVVDKVAPVGINGSQLILTVNNDVVPQELWSTLKIDDKMIVGINVVPTGGGSARKVWASIAAIAITVVTVGAASWAAGAATGASSLAAAGGILSLKGAAYALIYGSVMVAGGMLASIAANAITGTPKQSNNNLLNSGSQSAKESKTQYVEGASNIIDPFGVVPICLGTNRMFPPQAVLPYTEYDGKNNYCRQVFTYGYGKVAVTDRKIGETLIENFKDFQIEDRLEGNLNQSLNLFSNDVYQETFSVLLKNEDGWVERSTQTDCNEAIVDMIFPQGLVKYNNLGNREMQTVVLSIECKPHDSEDWESLDSKTFPAQDYSFTVTTTSGYLAINQNTGEAKFFEGQSAPDGWLSIGYLLVRDASNVVESVYFGDRKTVYSDKRGEYVETVIPDYNSFQITGDLNENFRNSITFNIHISEGTILGQKASVTVSDATAESFVVSRRFVFPQAGQYDIRIRRETPDNVDNDRILDEVNLLSIRSVTYQNPIKQRDISGTAIRIKATDQLNGTLDKYNAIVSSLVTGYDPVSGFWKPNIISSNPADLFRYVLQSPAFAKRLPDNRIDITKLEEWWKYCHDTGLTYNRIIDYEASIDDVLNDICAAGVATLSKIDGLYSVIIDNERPVIKGLVTPRNSYNYKGSLTYPEIPHALRVQFRNSEKGYETDERIVYDEGYNEANAQLYERVEFLSCTNSDLAYWYAKRYYATMKLQPETHTFQMDFENLTFNRGDRITLVNDVILVGAGQGRIKEIIVDNTEQPTVIKGFTVDDMITIPSANKFGVRIRHANGTGFSYYLLKTVVGQTTEFEFEEEIPFTEDIGEGSLCAFVEDGKELDLIITEIKAGKNQTATITALDYAPARFDPLGTIPPWDSNVTLPPDFFAPLQPELNGEIQSDESVMIKNSDGSYTSVMIIPLKNPNESSVIPNIRCKLSAGTNWFSPTYLKRDTTQIVLTGLIDGAIYDIEIRYQRAYGLQLLSTPLTLKNVKFVGGSSRPADVTGFTYTPTDNTGLFEWNPNSDIDISHYIIRFSPLTSGVTWQNSQTVADNIKDNRISIPLQTGTFLIKAVDVFGNESKNPTLIVSFDEGVFENVFETLTEHPDWLGEKINCYNSDGTLNLVRYANEGYYYFDPDVVDLGQIYEVSFTSTIVAWLSERNKIRSVLSMYNLPSLRKSLISVRNIPSIRSKTSIRSLEEIYWDVKLQMSTSNDNINWSQWMTFTTSRQRFRYVKFRLYMMTENEFTTPEIRQLSVSLDMPDRRETGDDILIENAEEGKTIIYNGAFKNNPSVNITLQDSAVDDRLEFTKKDNEGFTVRVFNATLNQYVSRSFDYIAAGYGRVISTIKEGV